MNGWRFRIAECGFGITGWGERRLAHGERQMTRSARRPSLAATRRGARWTGGIGAGRLSVGGGKRLSRGRKSGLMGKVI